jgi:hypothetical protein
MTEPVKRLKANKVLEGQPCGWCQAPLKFGEDAAVCSGCETRHHGACWDTKGGCSLASCENAPLKRMEPAAAAAPGAAKSPPKPGMIACPHCGKHIAERAPICRYCKQAPTPDGLYRGPKENAPGAVASLVCGIIGLFLFGIVLGIVAIVNANKAKRLIASDPRYGGGGMATAGLILGIICLVAFVIQMMVFAGRS